MITQVNPDKQLLESVFRTTMLSKIITSKSNKKSSQKNIDDILEKLIIKFNTISSQLNDNKNIVSQFCISQLQKRKSPKIGQSQPGLYSLQRIDIRQMKKQQKGCLQKKKSQRINQIQYTYLRMQENLYMFNYAFIPSQNINVTFILSQSRIQCIFSYVQLCLHFNSLVRCIMPIAIWQRVNVIYDLFWGNSIFQLLSKQNLLLFPQEKTGSFDFQNSMLLFTKKLWLWDSFDLYLVLKGSKYLIRGPGIQQNQVIYSAWRSNVIDQAEYCRLIDKTLKSNVIWGNSISDRQYIIKQHNKHYKTPGAKSYQKFKDCQIFLSLPSQIVQEIYQCGQITEYLKGQIIYKSSSSLDKFYIIIQGQLLIEKQQNSEGQSILRASDHYYLKSIIEQVLKLKTTIKVLSEKSVVFSIDIWKLRYLLGHFMEQISMIIHYECKLQLSESMKIGKWTQKLIKMDEKKSINLSQNSTKKMGYQRIKISKQLWKKLCIKDLNFLFLTLQQEDDILQ